MKRRPILTTFIICQSIFCWLSTTPAMAQPLASRSATADSYTRRGNAWFAKGDSDGALADYNQAIKLAPRFAKAWSSRGILWKAKGYLRRAEEDLTHAIELQPKLADAYAHRGLARLLQGRAGDANSDFDRYLSLGGNSKESLDRLIAEAKQQFREGGKQ